MKEFQKFEDRVIDIIKSLDRARSWSDLLPFSQDLFILLEKKKEEFNFSFLSNKTVLSKRLAQCLNPECPSGLHEIIINIYALILGNILSKNNNKLKDNLGIYSSGLFPFFSYASFPNKKLYLESIIKNCFLKLQQEELNTCLSGLLSSLIPGLDDNNEEITKLIYSNFDALQKNLKKGVFYGTYWSLLLRNKLLRPNGIKYVTEYIIKYEDYQKLDEKRKKEIKENEFPNVNNLIVNSLSQIIEEEKELSTVRLAMDFIILRFPLTQKNTILNEQAKIVLISNALRLLLKNEYSTTRRLAFWLTGTNNIEDVNINSNEIIYKLELIVNAFKGMFDSQKIINSNNLKGYVQILDNLFSIIPEFAEYILPKIAYDLILCFVIFWKTELNSSENVIKNDTINKLNKFFHRDSNYIEFLWTSIINYLDSSQEGNNLDFQNIKDYMNMKKIEKFIYQIIHLLKFSYLFIDVQSNDQRVKYYIPIINNLLKIMNKLKFEKQQIQKVRHILSTTLIFTKILQEKNLQNNNTFSTAKSKDTNIETKNNDLNKKRTIFTDLNKEDNQIKKANEYYNISEESSCERIFKNKNDEVLNSFTDTIANYENFYKDLLKIFLLFKKNTQITKNEIYIFRNSTELMIRLQEYAKENKQPEWMQYIKKIIFDEEINIILSLEAANCLLDLNLSSFKGHEKYQNIKSEFSEKEINSNLIDKHYLNSIIIKTGVNNNCKELLIGKLYLIVSAQSNRKMIIDILMKLSRLDKEKFLNILENTFKLEGNLSNSLKLFSDFWQLLNEYYSENLLFVNGECLFQMLDYLDCENPLLRHLSKSWLDQSIKQFKKIVDPILKRLIDPNIIVNENYLVEKESDTKKIIHSYKALKSLILNSSIIKFFIENNPNDEILQICEKIRLFSLNILEKNYIYILIEISLRFIRAKIKEDLKESLQKDNLSINSSSCQFLEFLLSHINNTEIIMQYAKQLNMPILELINEAIDIKNEVMQVQLLSVLKVLYFTTIPIHLKYKKESLLLFGNQALINCLKKGMTSDNFFLRENFINFTRECLPCFKKIMDEDINKDSYYKFGTILISSLTSYLIGRITIDTKGRKDTERFSHFDENNNVNYFIYKNYLDEYKEYKIYDEVNVLLILKGLRDIIYYFFNIKSNDKRYVKEFWPDFKNDLIESQKIPTGFLFGLFSGESEKNDDLDKKVKGLYTSQIMDILQSLLLTWTNKSDKYEPYDFCLNVNGILPLREVNKEIFTDQDIKEGIEYISTKPLKKIVRNLGLNLFLTNPIEFIETIIKLWCYTPRKSQKEIVLFKDAQYKITIIEFLISLDIPLNIILLCLNILLQKNIKIEKEKEKSKQKIKYQKDSKTKAYITPHDVGVFEAKLIHFIYSYIQLNPFYQTPLIIYFNDNTRSEICESWREMISFINTLISDTKIIYTYCWIYELLQLTLFKFSLDKVCDNNIKNKLYELFNTITDKLTDCAFNNKTDSINVNEGILILPYLPHIYLNIVKEVYPEYFSYLYNKYFISGQNINEGNISQLKTNTLTQTETQKFESSLIIGISSKVNDFYSLYYSSTKLNSERLDLAATPSSKCEFLNLYYRYLACLTLKENFSKIFISIYGDSNLAKKNITDIIKQLINFLKSNSQDENEEKMFYAEFASDFLVSLMKDCPLQATIYGKYMLMDYLNYTSFFVTTPKILRNWRRLISISVKYYPEILSELIKNINTGFFGGSDEDKIKTLRRISFVIYSCEKDTFKKDFENIKENAKSFLTGHNYNIKLEAEIFLLMRILFLRFSHESVMKMIKDLWPIIFTELIENFKNEKRNKHITVLIESFKFIELLSLANEEEFSLYQWIFLLDTFNMKDLDTRDPNSLLSKLINKGNEIFRPIAVDIISREENQISVDDDMIEGKKVGKSELVIKTEGETLEELQKALKKFFYSIGDMNNYKVELNYEQIEDIIEKDFLLDMRKK